MLQILVETLNKGLCQGVESDAKGCQFESKDFTKLVSVIASTFSNISEKTEIKNHWYSTHKVKDTTNNMKQNTHTHTQ